MTTVKRSIAVVSLASNLTLGPGEYVTVFVQHGFKGCSFTVNNSDETAVISTVSVATIIRERLKLAGFVTSRIGQVISALSAGNVDSEPVVLIEGKPGAVTFTFATALDQVEVAHASRVGDVALGTGLGALASSLFSGPSAGPR